MRWILIITTALFVNFNSIAGHRFIIETEKSITNVSLINSKLGSVTRLLPGRDDKMSFLFEVEDIDNIYLKFPSSLLIKLYSLSDKVESDWHKVVEDERISVKSFFSKNTSKNIELDKFVQKRFMSIPLAGSEGTLRGNSFFYTPDNMVFLCPEKLSIAWKANCPFYELKLYDMAADYAEIYTTSSFSDSVFQFASLPENVKKSLNQNSNYCLMVKTSNGDYGYSENQLTFCFDSFCFSVQSGDLYFIEDQDFDVKWNAPEKETTVKLYDCEKNLVYETRTTDKQLLFNNLSNFPLKSKKSYKIELTQDNKTISKCFYILYCNQDYTVIK